MVCKQSFYCFIWSDYGHRFKYSEQGRAKIIFRTRHNRRFMVEMQCGINVEFFLEDSFGCFQSDGEFIPDPRHSDRKHVCPS